MRIQITFKSGAKVEADVENFTVKRTAVTNVLRGLDWDLPNDWLQELHYVDLAEVAAIVAVRPAV